VKFTHVPLKINAHCRIRQEEPKGLDQGKAGRLGLEINTASEVWPIGVQETTQKGDNEAVSAINKRIRFVIA